MKKNNDRKRLENALEKLRECYVIVEGKKDAKALEKLGIKAKPYTKKSIEMAKGEVVIFMDRDKEGKRKEKEAEEKLRENIKVDKIDSYTPRIIAGVLKVKRVEEIEKKYEKFLEVDKDG